MGVKRLVEERFAAMDKVLKRDFLALAGTAGESKVREIVNRLERSEKLLASQNTVIANVQSFASATAHKEQETKDLRADREQIRLSISNLSSDIAALAARKPDVVDPTIALESSALAKEAFQLIDKRFVKIETEFAEAATTYQALRKALDISISRLDNEARSRTQEQAQVNKLVNGKMATWSDIVTKEAERKSERIAALNKTLYDLLPRVRELEQAISRRTIAHPIPFGRFLAPKDQPTPSAPITLSTRPTASSANATAPTVSTRNSSQQSVSHSSLIP